MKKIFLTVTTDLSYDQRMIRICTSLALNGYAITLVGREVRASIPLTQQPFTQKRIRCFFEKGILFYAEYNIRLFFYLLARPMDGICAIDLDTILACYFCSVIKKKIRILDAHELFCEMKEIVTRPHVYRIWKAIERYVAPRFTLGYTVNDPIADAFKKMYGVHYEVIRSITVYREISIPPKEEKYLLYQGSVNEGRSFETLIPAMCHINSKLIICGDGNFMQQCRQLVAKHGLESKVIFKGKIAPALLSQYTLHAWIGITLFENNGLSNYLSLANRFFDYMHAGVPQLCVNYPAYQIINNMHQVAVLINDLSPESIAAHCNRLLQDASLYANLQMNCLEARKVFNWQNEEKKLIGYYKNIFS